jgi:hypothetical protein
MTRLRLRLIVSSASLVFGLLLSTSTYPISAQAATVKNGIACKKINLKTKVGSKNYICGRNPYVSPTKLTWMLRQCPQTYDLYIESKDQYDIFKDILNSAGNEGKVEADKLLKGISDLEVLMKTKVCKRGN